MAQFEAKEIGARIAQARKEAGLTQEQLAELAPFSTRSLQNYERGEIIPYRQLRDISTLLKRPVDWFLHGEAPDEPALLERLAALERKIDELDRKLDLVPDPAPILSEVRDALRSLVREARETA